MGKHYELMKTVKAKKTFLNLGPERQREIIDVAVLEFTLNDYENASLSNIIKKLNLAKGSFYRYFQSKKDLYLYLIEYTTRIRFEEIEELAGKNISLETLLIENYKDKIKYDQKYPLYSGFGYRVLREINNKELGDVIRGLRDQILSYTRSFLEAYLKKGLVKENLDLEAVAFMIYQNQVGFFEYLSYRYNIDYLKNIEQGEPIYSIPEEKIIESLKSFVKILIHGIVIH